MTLEVETIEQFLPLYDEESPHYKCRYLTFYGGRGGRKSWETARALLIRGIKEKLLILCAREIQNSINDSVHRLLSSQIQSLGITQYTVQQNRIVSTNGTEFIFKGLNGLTIDSIKSLEGVDICWVEEGHSVSEHSWEILIPTIRKEESQIITTFNPDLETDPAYQRFVLNSPPNSYTVKVSYLDNPDCPQTLIDEANYLKMVNYDAYSHIWLGNLRMNSDVQVFRNKYKAEAFDVDDSFGYPMFGGDYGFSNDPVVLIKCYSKNNILYVRHEVYKVNCEIDDHPLLFQLIPDSDLYQLNMDNARPEITSYLNRHGYNIKGVDKWPGCDEERVMFLRNFEQIIVHPDCVHTLEELRLYSYKKDRRTGAILPQLEDKNNHCMNSLGYAIKPRKTVQTEQTFITKAKRQYR